MGNVFISFYATTYYYRSKYLQQDPLGLNTSRLNYILRILLTVAGVERILRLSSRWLEPTNVRHRIICIHIGGRSLRITRPKRWIYTHRRINIPITLIELLLLGGLQRLTITGVTSPWLASSATDGLRIIRTAGRIHERHVLPSLILTLRLLRFHSRIVAVLLTATTYRRSSLHSARTLRLVTGTTVPPAVVLVTSAIRPSGAAPRLSLIHI